MNFRSQLETAAYQWPMETSRFITILNKGRCPISLLQRYAIKLHLFSEEFPALQARLIKIVPVPEVKLSLLENLLEESGIFLNTSIGLKVKPSARHTEWSKRFALACGVTTEQFEQSISSNNETTADTYLNENRWLEAIAYLMIGMEANLPRTFKAMLPGLREAGFSERDITYFSAHIEADTRHGAVAFSLIEQCAVTSQQKEQVLEAVALGAETWWLRHNSTPATQRAKSTVILK